MSETTEYGVPIRAITQGPRHHFFGYYDKTPWDATGRYILALEVPFMDRPPGPEDRAIIGLVDREHDTFTAVTETRAWNWQQGCMLHWLPTAPEREIIFNDRDGDRFVSVVMDVHTGARRTLPMPIYALSPDGLTAIAPNFSRLATQRPGYGYAGVPDPWAEVLIPEDDGIYRLDVATGACERILSIGDIARYQHHASMEGVMNWLNHLQFDPSGQRFIFLHRWRRPATGLWSTQLLTAASNGTALHCVADDGMVSHFDWRDPRHVLAWASQPEGGNHYYLFDDGDTGAVEIVGNGVLTTDGHCSYSPDRRWILTDTYPDAEHRRTLLLYDPINRRRVDLGRFYSPPNVSGELRCDLHPRWNRDGTQICIDSAHAGERQMYVLDLAEIVTQ